MKSGFVTALAAVAYVVTWLVVAVAGPDKMPAHRTFDGTIDRWGSRGEFLAHSGIGAAVVVVLLLLAFNLRRLPVRGINTPHREYWLSPEHRGAFDAITRSMLIGIAGLVLFMFTMINISGMWLGEQSWFFPTVLVIFLIGMACVIGFPIRRLYREPS